MVFLPTLQDLYNNISAIYPHAQIWLAGHSLGGALAAMLSRTYGVPSISFEAPGDLLPSRRLHLPLPPHRAGNETSRHNNDTQRSLDDELTTHVFHNADPIPMGVCSTSSISMCGIAGFALESKCHVGKKIVYDTVGKLGWSVDIRTHSIRVIVDNLLKEDWGKKPEGSSVESDVARESGFGWWPRPRKGKQPAEGGGGDGEDEDDSGDGGDQPDGDDGSDGSDGHKDDPEADDGQHGGRGVPQAVFEDEDCVDCSQWTYV